MPWDTTGIVVNDGFVNKKILAFHNTISNFRKKCDQNSKLNLINKTWIITSMKRTIKPILNNM